MQSVIAWCGFLGAWLLVAGAVYQAAIELGNEEFERDKFAAAAAEMAPLQSPSRWWWLLPPVWYVKNHRARQEYRQAIVGHLSPDDLKMLVSLIDTASGWLFVGLGGLLIAVKETWELTEHHEWPLAAFVVLIVVMLVLTVANTALRVKRSAGMLEQGR